MRALAVLLLAAACAGCGSHDAGKIAFTAMADSGPRLLIADGNGGSDPIVVERAAGADYPLWSPDGSLVAFYDSDAKSTYISAVRADGTHYRRLLDDQNTNPPFTWTGESGIAVQWNGIEAVGVDGRGRRRLAAGFEPSGSPDGRRVAFVRGGSVFVMKSDGTGAHAVARPDGSIAYDDYPAIRWSPDSHRIAYVTWAYKNPKTTCESSGDCTYVDPATNIVLCVLHIVDVDTGTRATVGGGGLLGSAYRQCSIAWTADSTKVAFTRNGTLYAVTADGRHEQRLVRGLAPAFSPDGRRLAFFRKGVLYLFDLKERRARRLVRTDDVSWSPDGKQVAVAHAVQEPGRFADGTSYEGQYAIERIDVATGRAHRIWPPFGTCDCVGSPVWQPR